MDQAEREEFGAYLKGLRNAKGLTQRDVARLAKVSSPYLTQMERGQRNPPSKAVLKRLAVVYGVREDRLIQQAGYLEDRPPETFPRERVEWAFECAKRDPEFIYATRLKGETLDLETKRLIVEMYQKITGKDLLAVHSEALIEEDEHASEIPRARP